MGVTKDDLFIPEGASHREGGFFTAAVSFANACRKQNLPVYLYEFCHDRRVVMTVLSTLRNCGTPSEL